MSNLLELFTTNGRGEEAGKVMDVWFSKCNFRYLKVDASKLVYITFNSKNSLDSLSL